MPKLSSLLYTVGLMGIGPTYYVQSIRYWGSTSDGNRSEELSHNSIHQISLQHCHYNSF